MTLRQAITDKAKAVLFAIAVIVVFIILIAGGFEVGQTVPPGNAVVYVRLDQLTFTPPHLTNHNDPNVLNTGMPYAIVIDAGYLPDENAKRYMGCTRWMLWDIGASLGILPDWWWYYDGSFVETFSDEEMEIHRRVAREEGLIP